MRLIALGSRATLDHRPNSGVPLAVRRLTRVLGTGTQPARQAALRAWEADMCVHRQSRAARGLLFADALDGIALQRAERLLDLSDAIEAGCAQRASQGA